MHNDNADEDFEYDIAYDAEVKSMLWYEANKPANTAMPEPLE
jgi:hypothetical protein